MRGVILAGGPIDDYQKVHIGAEDMVICADSGARHASVLGVSPGLIIGDMDSVDPGLLKEFESRGCKVSRHPKEKNEVDTELALEAALSYDPDEIVIYGGTGERLDHTLANIHLLTVPAQRGVPAFLYDSKQRITLVTPDLGACVEGRGTTFSLLPLTFEVKGVQVKGAFWDLDKAVFTIGKPYGVSNVVREEKAIISIEQGMLILIISR